MSNSIFTKDGTAQGVAKQRLIETLARPHRRVINDPYAERYVIGSSTIKLMGHRLSVWLTQKFAPGFHQHLVSRTRFIDDLIESCTTDGITQYVILGAGYDLRAHRLNLPSTLQIYEVDQAEVQRRKRAKLPKNLSNADNVNYVSVDFNHQTLRAQLLDAGYDTNKPTVFTLEGVSQYISKEAVKSTINEIVGLTQGTKAVLYMSYVNELINTHPQDCFGRGYPNPKKKVNLIKNMAAKVGEPWISFYSNKEIEEVLAQQRFSLIENKTLADLNVAYFTPVGRTLPEDQLFNLEHSIVAIRS